MTITECKQETLRHIMNVQNFINIITNLISKRGVAHDSSKLNSPEVEVFTEYTPKLEQSTYNSDEYKQFLKEMSPALKHHYSNNRHHPEYFKNGIDDMNLIDIVEMLCDWKAASLRHGDGDLMRSIEINQKRFNISDQLKSILINTAYELYKYKVQWNNLYSSTTDTYISSGCCVGDTVEQVRDKIDAREDLGDNTKIILKFGLKGEFNGNDYYNKIEEIKGSTIEWIVR
jgi:hypothetical protein